MDRPPLPRMGLAYLGAVLYVGIAAVRATHGATETIVALVTLPLLVIASGRVQTTEVAHDLVGNVSREGFRIVVTGTCVYMEARSAGAGRLGFDAAAAAGTGITVIAALVSLARVPPTPGLIPTPPAARRLDAAAIALLVAIVAVTIPAAAALSAERRAVTDPLTIDYTISAAAGASLLVLGLASLRFRVARRLELGVVERASAALAVSTLMLLIAALASALDIAPHDRVLPVCLHLASLAISAALVTKDPTVIAALLRTGSAAAVLGVPIALFAATVVASAPRLAGGVTLLASIILIVVGLLAPRVARVMTPSSALWLTALEVAHRKAVLPDPGDALQGTLAAIRNGLGAMSASPLLLRTETHHVLSVDRAGYVHEAPGDAPAETASFCDREPGHTLRLEVVRALEVRDPAIRPILAWMEAHALASVTTLRDESGVIGMIAMPHRGQGPGARRSPLTLDEVIALDNLAERLASVLSFSSSVAVARARVEAADAALEVASARIVDLSARADAFHGRHRDMTLRLAREAGIASSSYSPAARLAEADLARAMVGDAPVVVLAPAGTAAVAWVAAAHDASPYASSPLVVVQGSDAREHAPSRWADGLESHLEFARDGSLVLVDVHALPHAVQRTIASQIALRAEDPSLPRIVVILRETVDALVVRHQLVEELADVLGGRLVAIPGLVSRAEDIRPVALDHLSRLGAALRGAPLGLTDEGLALLLDHAWPGNEQELASTLLLAVLVASPPHVTARDLRQSGFTPIEPRSTRSRSEPPRRARLS